MVTLHRSAKDTLTTGIALSTEDVVSAGVILAMADVVSTAFTFVADVLVADVLATADVVSTGGLAAAVDVAACGNSVSTVDGVSMDDGVVSIVLGAAAWSGGSCSEASSYVAGDEAVETGEIPGWMTQSLCLGVGNGFDSASGSATVKTRIPHSPPPIRTALSEIRFAEVAASNTFMSTPVDLE